MVDEAVSLDVGAKSVDEAVDALAMELCKACAAAEGPGPDGIL